MSYIHKELEQILQSLTIVSHSTFIFNGTEYKSSFSKNHDGIALLTDFLYRIYHCRDVFPLQRIPYLDDYSQIKDFTAELSLSNGGTGTWEDGWRIERIESDGSLAVKKNDLTLWILAKYFKSDSPVPRVGQKGLIKMVREFRKLSPGFYMAIGDAPLPRGDIYGKIIRIYWNIVATHAARLVCILTSELNGKHIPFKFKILNNPYLFPRADAAVLYVDKSNWTRSKKSISIIYSKIRPFLNSPTPLFAKRLVPGISLAEDPNNGESFGQNRSRILSEAIFKANGNKQMSVKQNIKKISAYFKKLGVNLDCPYLNKGSLDEYKVSLK